MAFEQESVRRGYAREVNGRVVFGEPMQRRKKQQ